MGNLTLGEIFRGRQELLQEFKAAAAKAYPNAGDTFVKIDAIEIEGAFTNRLLEAFFELHRCGWTAKEGQFMAYQLVKASLADGSSISRNEGARIDILADQAFRTTEPFEPNQSNLFDVMTVDYFNKRLAVIETAIGQYPTDPRYLAAWKTKAASLIEDKTTRYHQAFEKRPRIQQDLDGAEFPFPDARYPFFIKQLLDLEAEIDNLFSDLRILAFLYYSKPGVQSNR